MLNVIRCFLSYRMRFLKGIIIAVSLEMKFSYFLEISERDIF